jgi:hypothetical protein
VSLLIVEVVFRPRRRDQWRAVGGVLEHELAWRQGRQPVVPDHADVDLPPLDELLGDRVRAQAPVHEGHPLGELVVGLHQRGLRDA